MTRIICYSLLSSALLVLSFSVFGFWYLGFIGLVPFFYLLYAEEKLSLEKTAAIGFFFGFLFAFCLNIWVLFAHFAVWFLAGLVYGSCMSFFAVIVRILRRRDLWDIFVFSACWVLFEWIRQLIFQGFDYSTIAYSAYGFLPLLNFASIGGLYLVSFILATINGFIGFSWVHGIRKKTMLLFVIFLVACAALFGINYTYINSGNKAGTNVSFASIQLKENSWPYASMQNGKLVLNGEPVSLIQLAVSQHTNYIVYPFNVVSEILIPQGSGIKNPYISATFEDVNALLSQYIPATTTFVFWTDTIRPATGDSNIFDETDWWNNGQIIGFYQKRYPYPFYDITGNYFRKAGVFLKPYGYTPSPENKTVNVSGERFGNLSCSELNYSFLARNDSKLGSNIIMSLGYASVFEYPVLGTLDVTLAQFRAVETNQPIVRSDIRGPSVFITASGQITAEMDANQNGVLVGTLFVQKNPRKTIYTLWGDYPLISLLFIFVLYMAWKQWNNRGIS